MKKPTKTFNIAILITSCAALYACGGGVKLDDPFINHQHPEPHLLKTGSREAFENSLKTYLLNRPKNSIFGNETKEFAGAPTVNTAMPTTAAAGSESADMPNVSTTNTIEAAVDEGDYQKTDGEFLYRVKTNHENYFYPMTAGIAVEMVDQPIPSKQTPPQIEIYRLNPATAAATLLKTISVKKEQTIAGIYITGASNKKKLIVVTSEYRSADNYRNRMFTQLTAFDVNQPEQATELWRFEIEGYSNATRLLNDRVYLVTRNNFYIPNFIYWVTDEKSASNNAEIVKQLNIDDLMPQVRINGEKTKVVTPDRCAVPTTTDVNSYFDMGLTGIVGINVNDPQDTHAFCTLENGNDVYVSDKSLYLTKPAYDHDEAYTVIHKLALNETEISYRASGSVHGMIGWRNSAFKISEHNDTLRIITTEYRYDLRNTSEQHYLFTLREDNERPNHLKTLARLPNDRRPQAIGKPNEQLYGVRFFGDYGYAVTFQRIDPLYVFNLKDPSDPFIEGALELPGYSDYLHPIDNNTLLGIGKDAQSQNGATFFQGIKIGLFDTTDKTKPQLLSEIKLGKRGSETSVFSDYKAFTLLKNKDVESWRFAMPVSIHDGETTSGKLDSYMPFSYCGLALFEIQNRTIQAVGTLKTPNVNSSSSWYNCELHQSRSSFVNDAVYYSASNDIWSALWNDTDHYNAISPHAINVKQWKINKAKWESQRAIAYNINYQLDGVIDVDFRKPFTLAVEDGMIKEIRYTETDTILINKPFDTFYSIEELFDRIGSALNARNDMTISYDESTGFPTHIEIDDSADLNGPDFIATLNNLSIQETLSRDQIVTISGELNYLEFSTTARRTEYRFTIRTDAGKLVDIANGNRLQNLLADKQLYYRGRMILTGYWRGPAYQTNSRFVVTSVESKI